MKTVTFRNFKISIESEIKLVRFDEAPQSKRPIKIKDITQKNIQEITDLYKDLYLVVNGRNVQLKPSDAGRILLKLTSSDKKIINHLNKFIDFEEAVDNNLKNRSLKININ